MFDCLNNAFVQRISVTVSRHQKGGVALAQFLGGTLGNARLSAEKKDRKPGFGGKAADFFSECDACDSAV